ncbi:Pectinesterase 31 [Asimina triloba]
MIGDEFLSSRQPIVNAHSPPKYLLDTHQSMHYTSMYYGAKCITVYSNKILPTTPYISTALLEHCHIHCKSAGFITAQSRKSSQESTGYVFLRCVITGNGGASYSYLGRPWGPFGRVVFAYTWMDACVNPVGWHNWNKAENERSACFCEYRCSGPGCFPSERVAWCRELVDEEAEQFLMHYFIDPDSERPWLAQRMALKVPLSA